MRTPGGDTTFNAILFFGLGAYSAYRGFASSQSLFVATGAVALLIGGGLWFRRNWARLLGITFTACWSLLFAWALYDRGFSAWNLLGLICTAFVAWDLFKESFESDDDDGKLISIVLLLKEPRRLELETVRQAVLRAWGISLGQDQEANEWIAEVGPSFGLKTRFGIYALHVAPQPYVDDQEETAEDMVDQRLAHIIRTHKAWYAVDLMEVGENSPAPEKAYPYIGQLLAELVDDNCLGVYCPETQRLNPNTPELLEKLRGPHPLEDLTAPAELPVISVDEEDADMKAAVAEARSKWPEFLQAYSSRQAENFAVKAPITSAGQTEFIWIEVETIEGDRISGKLGNEPANLPGFKLGSSVTVNLSELNDWIYMTGEQMHGGFTIKVVQAAMKKLKEARATA